MEAYELELTTTPGIVNSKTLGVRKNKIFLSQALEGFSFTDLLKMLWHFIFSKPFRCMWCNESLIILRSITLRSMHQSDVPNFNALTA